MAGMDDKEDPENTITLEAMSGLSRILSQLDEASVRQILINICLRIRPCYEKVSSNLVLNISFITLISLSTTAVHLWYYGFFCVLPFAR